MVKHKITVEIEGNKFAEVDNYLKSKLCKYQYNGTTIDLKSSKVSSEYEIEFDNEEDLCLFTLTFL